MAIITRTGADYLWRAASTPAVMGLRARAWTLLGIGPGARVLDIGCGPGTTILGLTTLTGPFGLVAGVDNDPEMVREAQAVAAGLGASLWTRFQEAGATALPFPDGSFDACYCERVLQHLEPSETAAAVAEAMRVLRPGGAAVFVDTDWASLSVNTTENALERRLQTHLLARFRNPFSARSMGRTLRVAGLGFVFSEAFALPLAHEVVAALLAGAEQDANDAGALTAAEQEAWHAAMTPGPDGASGHVIMMTAFGRRL